MDNGVFGDYIVFVDESGDQSLKSIDEKYPVFVLSFCIFEKTHYYQRVVPEMLRFKFDFSDRISLFCMSERCVSALVYTTSSCVGIFAKTSLLGSIKL